MDRAAAELLLASLFVETTPERQEALRNAAQAATNWLGLLPSLESHGVLLLFQRNLEEAGIELPPAVAPQFQARTGEQRDEHHRARLTLQRFLASAALEGVEITLCGGSALCLDLYSSPLRRLGQLEAFVAHEHLTRALRAGKQAGLLQAEDSLPAWWYRRTRLPLALAPSSSLLRGVRLHSQLHHPSLLLTAREPEVLGRRQRTPFEGHALFQLDALDALLELCVTVAARAGEALLVSGRRHLLAAAGSGAHALRLDQLLDLRTFIERRSAECPPASVVARAREWSAEPALRAVIECIQMGLGFLPGAREWARQVAQAVAAAAGASSALFRPDPIERLPQWLRPSDAFLAQRYALPKGAEPRARHIARARHLAAVLGATAVAGLGYPLAWLGRHLSRDARRRAWAGAQEPQRLSDVNEAWRAAARAEQQKPITPRTISLPPPVEGVTRLPDHYKG
jgi:putative nucleotidyltransferase-like protein